MEFMVNLNSKFTKGLILTLPVACKKLWAALIDESFISLKVSQT
jgi:hypothetical protein